MSGERPEPPLALVAELTHRCPLQCPYCANPLELARASRELDTGDWLRVLDEAASLGVLQLHFSGGEPTVRGDLDRLVRHAAGLGMYSNLITSGVLLDTARLQALAEAGLDHLQLSLQDVEPGNADRIGGFAGGHAVKLAVARQVRAAGLALTLNFVVHRQNVERVPEMIALGETLGRGPHRNRPCAVLRLGAAEPRRAVAHPRAARRGDRGGRGGARAAARPAGDRLCRAGLLCEAAEGMHGRLGPAHDHRHACRPRLAMPRRREPARVRVPFGARDAACRHLAGFATPSRGSAARTGCRSRAGPATSARSIGAAAAARLLPSPAMPRGPIRPVRWRPTTR